MLLEAARRPGADIPEPRLKLVFDYWHEKRGARAMPARTDIDPVELRAVLGRIALVDVERDPVRFRYRLVGSHLTEILNEELTGRYVDEMPLLFRTFAQPAYAEVLQARRPVYREFNVVVSYRLVRYRRLLAPLSSDETDIDMILACFQRM